MSTIENVTVKCALCGKNSEQAKMMSVSAFDEPDLDFRPSEMLRSTMRLWLMECPHCGYVTNDIRKRPHMKKETLLRIYGGADADLPGIALIFQKRALYCEHTKDTSGAIRAYLCAAWACDDEEDYTHAKMLRVKCLELTQRYLKRCWRKKWRRYTQLAADLLRRTENIETLRQMDTNDKRLDYATRELLLFQKRLAEEGDFSAHSRIEVDLNPYADFFEKRISTQTDHWLCTEEYLKQAVSVNDDIRAKALEALDAFRPRELNLPYHEFDGALLLHRGGPPDEEHPYRTRELAQAVNQEFLDVLETFVVPGSSIREAVTPQNKVCMTMLYQLYTSPYLADDWKDYADARQRLYLMRVDDPFSDDSYLIGLIEPRASQTAP
ncbi:MAG: hypothetical protein VB084_04010 [Syntrophomonadaceae bacterium]|nr:hypothetical protein [Syntrophomonadaceae bacterium]